MRRTLVVSMFLMSTSAVTHSAEPLVGFFIAQNSCEAFQSKNRQTNPGDIFVEPDIAYPMIAINKVGGDYFQVRIQSAPVTTARWVHTSCGLHVVQADTQTSGAPLNSVITPVPTATESTENLLVLSWQPAFCEIRPNKTECQSLNDGDLPITETQLSLHGLWPQPRGNDYCGVSNALIDIDRARRWDQLPPVDIDSETQDELIVAMPGTQSYLERHEWIKHGTCYHGAGGADEYYDDTLLVMEAINSSSIAEFLAENVGAEVETSDIRQQFDNVFGDGAGDRVQFHCTGDQGRTLIQELKINLKGKIEPDTDISGLLHAADELSIGCPRGIIDPAGLQ